MIKRIFAILCFAILANSSNAMDLGRVGGTFTMHGEIEKGDATEFLAFLVSWGVPPTVFYITSMGGDLNEAMAIGALIRESQIPVWTGDKCYSACVFIYVAGVKRDARGKIGLHWPCFDKNHFSGLNSIQAKEQYNELKKKSIQYLDEMGVSENIISRVFKTDSTHVDIISAKEANQLFGTVAPFYEEWLTAKCGKYTDRQLSVIKSWGYLKAARATIAAARDKTVPKSENFGSNLQELVKKAQLALQMERTGKLEPYIELSKKHNECEAKVEDSYAFGFKKALKKYVDDLIKK